MSNSSDSSHNEHNRGGGLVKLADFVLSHRRRVMAFWVVLMIIGFGGAGAVTKRLSFDFSMPGQPGYVASHQIDKLYGNGGDNPPSLIVVNEPAGRTVAQDQAQITAAFTAVRAQFPQARIVDYASTSDPTFITKDGKTTYAMLFSPAPKSFSEKPLSEQVTTAVATQLPSAKVTATGTGELQTPAGDSSGGTSIGTERLIAGGGALIILAFVFASFLALIPLMIAIVAIPVTLLIVLGVTYLGEVSFIVEFLVSLVGLGVAIDYSLLVVTRWREERSKGAENNDAIRTAMATAGHAVLLSGLTVAIGLVALVVLPVPSLRSVGYGGMLIPLVSVATTLTLLPAILGGFGQKMDWPRKRKEENASRAWTAWATGVVKFRWLAAIVATGILVILCLPVGGLKIGQSSSSSLAKSGPAFDAYHTVIDNGISNGVLTPMEVITQSSVAQQAAAKLRSTPGISAVWVSNDAGSSKQNTAIIVAIPDQETVNSASTKSVKAARNAVAGMVGVIGISGTGPVQLDYMDAVFGNAPLVFAIIAILTFLLLARAFHSVVLAFKAILLNVISLSAIFGCLVFFWQQGHGSDALFDVSATGAITFWIPTMIFAFLFGLSMDYEVFIIARMREEYDKTGSTEQAVIVGIGRTGRLVTSAALILFLAFATLVLSGFTDLKVMATGWGLGILLDATIVRAFLLPALVALFGEWNWWMPNWLATVLRTEVPAKAAKADAVTV